MKKQSHGSRKCERALRFMSGRTPRVVADRLKKAFRGVVTNDTNSIQIQGGGQAKGERPTRTPAHHRPCHTINPLFRPLAPQTRPLRPLTRAPGPLPHRHPTHERHRLPRVAARHHPETTTPTSNLPIQPIGAPLRALLPASSRSQKTFARRQEVQNGLKTASQAITGTLTTSTVENTSGTLSSSTIRNSSVSVPCFAAISEARRARRSPNPISGRQTK